MSLRVRPYLFKDLRIRSRGYLPHWEIDNAFYFVTYRLADSLPAKTVELLRDEQRRIRRKVSGTNEPTLEDRLESSRLFGLRLDYYLDQGYGECYLRKTEVAKLVAMNLRFFDRERYELHAWTIMPNHVHVIFFLEEGKQLRRVLHSWKSYTGKEAKKALGLKEHFWQEEYFDRVVRDEEDLARTASYVIENPRKAGLENWPWVWSRR